MGRNASRRLVRNRLSTVCLVWLLPQLLLIGSVIYCSLQTSRGKRDRRGLAYRQRSRGARRKKGVHLASVLPETMLIGDFFAILLSFIMRISSSPRFFAFSAFKQNFGQFLLSNRILANFAFENRKQFQLLLSTGLHLKSQKICCMQTEGRGRTREKEKGKGPVEAWNVVCRVKTLNPSGI